MASAKETRHRLKGATDTARWGYGVRGPDGGVQARRPPLWGTRRGSMGFSESQHSSSKTRHTAEDGGGDEMQLHEPMSPLRRRAQPGPGWGGASMRCAAQTEEVFSKKEVQGNTGLKGDISQA